MKVMGFAFPLLTDYFFQIQNCIIFNFYFCKFLFRVFLTFKSIAYSVKDQTDHLCTHLAFFLTLFSLKSVRVDFWKKIL